LSSRTSAAGAGGAGRSSGRRRIAASAVASVCHCQQYGGNCYEHGRVPCVSTLVFASNAKIGLAHGADGSSALNACQ
jgi:hypothetical protein